MRHLFVVAGLAAALSLVHISGSQAGSVKNSGNASYSSATNSAPVSRAANSIPDNCIREACGRLFCWNTGNRR